MNYHIDVKSKYIVCLTVKGYEYAATFAQIWRHRSILRTVPVVVFCADSSARKAMTENFCHNVFLFDCDCWDNNIYIQKVINTMTLSIDNPDRTIVNLDSTNEFCNLDLIATECPVETGICMYHNSYPYAEYHNNELRFYARAYTARNCAQYMIDDFKKKYQELIDENYIEWSGDPSKYEWYVNSGDGRLFTEETVLTLMAYDVVDGYLVDSGKYLWISRDGLYWLHEDTFYHTTLVYTLFRDNRLKFFDEDIWDNIVHNGEIIKLTSRISEIDIDVDWCKGYEDYPLIARRTLVLCAMNPVNVDIDIRTNPYEHYVQLYLNDHWKDNSVKYWDMIDYLNDGMDNHYEEDVEEYRKKWGYDV